MVKILQKENLPGGGTLHSMMTPHGPDNKTFLQTSQQELKPVKMEGTMVCRTYVYNIIASIIYIYRNFEPYSCQISCISVHSSHCSVISYAVLHSRSCLRAPTVYSWQSGETRHVKLLMTTTTSAGKTWPVILTPTGNHQRAKLNRGEQV